MAILIYADVVELGSDGSAACGGRSDLSEWPRSTDEEGFSKPTKMSGTATGIVRRVDDLGRIVIPKEIRRTLRIREGDPSYTTLTPEGRFCMAIHSLAERLRSISMLTKVAEK